jgi:hypothetical protein
MCATPSQKESVCCRSKIIEKQFGAVVAIQEICISIITGQAMAADFSLFYLWLGYPICHRLCIYF